MADEAKPDDADGVLIEHVVVPDVLRSAFGYALAALIEHLPAGAMRDIAVAETMEAHLRAAAALARRRKLH